MMTEPNFYDPGQFDIKKDLRKTKLSIYSISLSRWAFLDPASITWETYNDMEYFIVGNQKIGILCEWRDSPEYIDIPLNKNEVIYRELVDQVYHYNKVESFALFKDLFTNIE